MCVHAQSCLTLCDPTDCSPPGSSVHGIILARILEWVAISFFRGSSQPRDRAHISYGSYIARWILYHWATWTYMYTVHIHNCKILCVYFNLLFPNRQWWGRWKSCLTKYKIWGSEYMEISKLLSISISPRDLIAGCMNSSEKGLFFSFLVLYGSIAS